MPILDSLPARTRPINTSTAGINPAGINPARTDASRVPAVESPPDHVPTYSAEAPAHTHARTHAHTRRSRMRNSLPSIATSSTRVGSSTTATSSSRADSSGSSPLLHKQTLRKGNFRKEKPRRAETAPPISRSFPHQQPRILSAKTSHEHSDHVANHRSLCTPSPIRALLWRWRWVLFALIAAMIIQSFLATLAAHNPRTEAVVVASTPLSTGDTLSQANTTTAMIPRELIPQGAISDLDSIEGKTIVAPLPEGAPIFSQQLFTSAFTTSPPAGMVVTSITLDDTATLSVMRPGDHLYLYSPPNEGDETDEAQLLTKKALVMAVREGEAETGILSKTEEKGVAFVAIPRSDANLVIGYGSKGSLHAVIASQTKGT